MATSLKLKIALSSSSIAGAKLNFNTEIESKQFNEVKQNSSEKWNKLLAKIEIKTDRIEDKINFYTAMYHAHIAPNLYSDVDGTFMGANGKKSNYNGKPNYCTFSLWDTFRASHPLFTLTQPQKISNFLEAFLMHFKETGLLPVWSLWGNETNCMIGYHSIPVIVDAYFKNLIPKKIEISLYNAMIKSANQNIRGIPEYKKYNFIPSDLRRNSVSTTLEYAFDDWCIAQMAKALNNTNDYIYFSNRALNYKNLFNEKSKLMQPKKKNGEWKKFNPFNASYGNDYTEANAFQYTWYVPHDMHELVRLMGRQDEFELMLDSIFNLPQEVGKHAAKDVSGFIGQYIHGNEPSHHISYLYNFTRNPHKTQEKVSQIINKMYYSKPNGLCGNEDCGQMSAWYIFSSLGFYPINPASGKYYFGTPRFPSAKINIGDNTFEIITKNYSPENIYIDKIKLNGNIYKHKFIKHTDIVNGGKLEFYMKAKHN